MADENATRKQAEDAANVIKNCIAGKKKDPHALLAAFNFFLSPAGVSHMRLLSDTPLKMKIRVSTARKRLLTRMAERGLV